MAILFLGMLSLNGEAILKIPLNKVAEGADLCLDNAVQFCSDARVLSEESSCDHALGLCIFAIEELGKAILLKEKATYALKDSKNVVILKHAKPEVIFKRPLDYLKTKGFSNKEVNPFRHHLSKLLYASSIMSMATHTNVIKSLDGKGFQTMDEMTKTIEEMLKQAYEIDVEKTDLRELAFYVDYDQKEGTWSKGRLKVTQTMVRQLAANIETAIELIRQWKIPSSPQKP
jgi:hypothetical protein